MRWHDLRHLFASALIAQGASASYLATVLGHSSPTVTMTIYRHEFERVEHEARFRALQEQVFGGVLG
jgi:integrase